MIKDWRGNETTAAQKAREVTMGAVSVEAPALLQRLRKHEGMTAREAMEVQRHMVQLRLEIETALGYDPHTWR